MGEVSLSKFSTPYHTSYRYLWQPTPIQALIITIQDCNDRNPLIRGLAIRTMSYIPLGPVLSAIRDPLRHSLNDSDPYVRKTAAICVAKLWMQDPRIVDKEGYITALRDLLADTNPTVVANAVAALTEISDRSDEITLKLNIAVASRLLAALGECSEYVFRPTCAKGIVLKPHQMGSSLHPRVFDELRAANTSRRRHTRGANICSIAARQLGRCPHFYQGSTLPDELYG